MEIKTRKTGTDNQKGTKFPVEEQGNRDDSDNPITFATPLVENKNEQEMEKFAEDKSDRLEQQEDKSKLEEIKKEQTIAEEKQIELDKDDQREIAISLINDVVVDDQLVSEGKIDMLNEIRKDYANVLTNEDKVDINHEINVLKDKIKIERKGQLDEKRKIQDEQRTEKRNEHIKKVRQQIQDSKNNRKIQKQLLASKGKSIKTSTPNFSQHTNKIDKDSATRLSLFLVKNNQRKKK